MMEKKIFFMGDGGRDAEYANNLLGDCLSRLSFLQQPPHSASQEEADQNQEIRREVEQELKEKAYELYVRITGLDPVKELERLTQAISKIQETHDEAPLLTWRVYKGKTISDEKTERIQTFWHAYNNWLFVSLQDAIDSAKSDS